MSALVERFMCLMSPDMRVTLRSRHTSLTCAASTTTAHGFFSTAITYNIWSIGAKYVDVKNKCSKCPGNL